jgi:hypothetical protein
VCPHCGAIGEASRSKGKTTRPGLWNCRACRKPFTVKIGTVFESSHVPLLISRKLSAVSGRRRYSSASQRRTGRGRLVAMGSSSIRRNPISTLSLPASPAAVGVWPVQCLTAIG